MTKKFPDKFLWGCATASYQVEGAADLDGRGKSIWDTFSHQHGKVKNNDNGDVSVDQYHRFEEDIEIMKNMGLKAYRFSISWSRIFPTGRGEVNPLGIDYYNRLINTLLRAGIEPWITLFHWDLPQDLQAEYGGWQSREVVDYFGDYAGFISEEFSDRVKNYFTLNEFVCFTDRSYGLGIFAPGLCLPQKELSQVRHNSLLAHGKAVIALRDNSKAKISVGIADNPKVCVPIIETNEHIQAAEKAMRIVNAPFITTVLEGKYPTEYLSEQGTDAPEFTDSEMSIISTKLDFIGVNTYFPTYIRAADNDLGYEIVDIPDRYPVMGADWIKFGPQTIYWSARHLKDIWGVDNIYISENGCAATDKMNDNGEILDIDRILYLREHLNNAYRALSEGYPIKGYFVWSFIDNFEWTDGYSLRFGIVFTDYETLKRTPKLSAEFYGKVIKFNAVV